MTRLEKHARKREALKLESLIIQSTYLLEQSKELKNHTETFKDWLEDLPKVYRNAPRKENE